MKKQSKRQYPFTIIEAEEEGTDLPNLARKGKHKGRSLINFTIHSNPSAQVCDVIVNQVKPNSLAVFVLVEGLI